MASTNKEMVFIIFTTEGLEQAQADIVAEQAALWINPSLQNTEIVAKLKANEIDVNVLVEEVNPDKEKAVLAALAAVEKLAPKTEILIEYI